MGEGRAVSNRMVLAVSSGERLQLQPMPAEEKQKPFLVLCRPVPPSTDDPHLTVAGRTASCPCTPKLKHSTSHSTCVQ